MPTNHASSRSTLMVNLSGDAADDSLLAITGELAKKLKAAVIGAAAYELVLEYGTAIAGVGGISCPQELFDHEIRLAKARLAHAEDHFRKTLGEHVEPLLWRSVLSDKSAASWLAMTARAADFIITHSFADGSYSAMFRHVNVGDLVMTAGRPVLLVPHKSTTLDLGTVLVGWRDTRESRAALSAALPLLHLAGRVIVASIVPKATKGEAQEAVQDVAAWLVRHGISAEGVVEVATGNDIEQIAALTHRFEVGLLVAGAYGHSRLREWVLGGVTMDLLLRPRCVTLIAH